MTTETSSIRMTDNLVASTEVLVQNVGGESVLLDLSGELFFGLDEVGTRIWELLGEQQDIARLHQALCEEYDADRDMILEDLVELIGRLAEVGLVKFVDKER